MPGGEFKEIKLSDYKGKWVVLFFYPLDFTFVCPTEIKAFNEKFDEFKKMEPKLSPAPRTVNSATKPGRKRTWEN